MNESADVWLFADEAPEQVKSRSVPGQETGMNVNVHR